MPNAIVLGAGMVGSVMAWDLARDDDFTVTVADRSDSALAAARARNPERISAITLDLSDLAAVRKAIEPFDIVLGAAASHLGYDLLRTVIEAGKNYADISFMPQDALDHDELARSKGVTAVVDCGVAPGMSNLLCGRAVAALDECDELEIYVGGLPVERRWPFQYKAGFAPADVIEEYTRPSRIVEAGEVVVREALSEPELMDLPGVGTVEAFNTDGLRSIADTLDVPNMKEKTLRYPGHIEIMRILRAMGLFSKDPIEVGGQRIVPLEVTSALMFPMWTYEEGEADLTVMRVRGSGLLEGVATSITWDLLDYYDPATSATSMSRTTAFPCAIIARLIARGELDRPGVAPPELLGHDEELVERVLAELLARGVRYETTIESIDD
ncbi:MAG: saccharopine dehydrogenase family protein [Phycisphaeraceae bacterium]|nr:saccharopine dehydrogenase family protein [Phycisphaeraceae bacterium]